MTAELAIYAAFVALSINIIGLWAINRMRGDQIRITNIIFKRLKHVETVLSHYDMIPLPWETQDISNGSKATKKLKQEGNVVYLKKEER
tara:strand:- start:1119 stop:1385 length:267 start_codon:yes stop_codon:yes gene_type:complete